MDTEELKASVMSRKDSTGLNILTDPSVHEYLSHIFEKNDKDSQNGGPDNELTSEVIKAMLRRKIAQYNMRKGSLTAYFVEVSCKRKTQTI